VAGAQIIVQSADVDARLGAIIGRLDDPAPLYRDIAELLLNSTRERFLSQTDPDGQGWTPLSPGYLKIAEGCTDADCGHCDTLAEIEASATAREIADHQDQHDAENAGADTIENLQAHQRHRIDGGEIKASRESAAPRRRSGKSACAAACLRSGRRPGQCRSSSTA
jgi:hypothetical protein